MPDNTGATPTGPNNRNGRRARSTQRTQEKTRDAQKLAWLEAFEAEGTVSLACKASGVGRSTAYEWRQADEAFALAWADIEQATTEAMEREAYRRAVEGVSEPMVSAGKHVTNVTKFSDSLLMFMLKSRRPEKYRDNVKVEHTGKDDGPVQIESLVAADAEERSARAAALLRDHGLL